MVKWINQWSLKHVYNKWLTLGRCSWRGLISSEPFKPWNTSYFTSLLLNWFQDWKTSRNCHSIFFSLNHSETNWGHWIMHWTAHPSYPENCILKFWYDIVHHYITTISYFDHRTWPCQEWIWIYMVKTIPICSIMYSNCTF